MKKQRKKLPKRNWSNEKEGFLEPVALLEYAHKHSLEQVVEKVREIPLRYIHEEYFAPLALRRIGDFKRLYSRWMVAVAIHIVHRIDKYEFTYIDNITKAVRSNTDAARWIPILNAIKGNLPRIGERRLADLEAQWKEKFQIDIFQ